MHSRSKFSQRTLLIGFLSNSLCVELKWHKLSEVLLALFTVKLFPCWALLPQGLLSHLCKACKCIPGWRIHFIVNTQQRPLTAPCSFNLCVSSHSLSGISLIFSLFPITSSFNLFHWSLLASEQRLSFLREKGEPSLAPACLVLCRYIIPLWLQYQSHSSV